MTDSISRQVARLASGECRWIGREDVHVYCRNPLLRTTGLDGRVGWERQPWAATYSVVCPSAGLKYGKWINAADAVQAVSSALSLVGR